MSKKFLIFTAMLALATTLFAENEKMSCESELGTCNYEISEEEHRFVQECICSTGYRVFDSRPIEEAFMPANEEECVEKLDEEICKGAPFYCENEAGWCLTSNDDHYTCDCIGVIGVKTGVNQNFSAEGCTAVLEKECGTEIATPRTICTDSEIFNACVSYETTFTNTCFESVTEEEIETILDTPVNSGGREGGLAEDIANCCQNESMRNVYKTKFECVEAAGSCENKGCCETCDVQLAYVGEEGAGESDGDVISPAPDDEADTDKTEIPGDTGDSEPTDGVTDSGDTENSEAPADGATAPAENKEEKKSDGCSLLFV